MGQLAGGINGPNGIEPGRTSGRRLRRRAKWAPSARQPSRGRMGRSLERRSERDGSLAAKEMDPSSGEKWLASLASAARATPSKARIESFSAIFRAERAGFVSE